MLRVLAPVMLLAAAVIAQPPRPRLVVLVSVDQLATWVVNDTKAVLPEDGSFFHAVTKVGLEFSDCAFKHAATYTGPGHATLSTGGTPSQHGIVLNDWFDRRTGLQYCCFDPGARGVGSPTAPANMGPRQLQGPTLGDTMKAHFGKRARVVSLSWKDRSAILMGGRSADAVIYADKSAGCWVSTNRIMTRLPPWLTKINAGRPFDRWHGSIWKRAGPDAAYVGLVDDRAFEEASPSGHRTLPRPVTGGLAKPGPQYYEEVYGTPFANDALMELIEAALVGEKLGQDEVPDLLCIGFTANDSCGHRSGPRSVEVRDMTLRTDAMLGALVEMLDARVGEGRWSMVVTADHGIAPVPESLTAVGVDAGRGQLSLGAAMLANRALQKKLGPPPEGVLRWVLNYDKTCLFLDYDALAKTDVTIDEAAEIAVRGASKAAGIQRAFSIPALMKGAKGPEPWISSIRASLYPGRSGDVYLLYKPWWINSTSAATHGSPYPHDSEVPLWFVGAGPWRTGRVRGAVSPGLGVVLLAETLGIPRPPLATDRVPPGARR